MNETIYTNSTVNIDNLLCRIIDSSINERDLENRTIEEIMINKESFRNMEQDRVRYLFEEILMTKKPSHGIRLLEKSGILKAFMPELQKCVGFDQRSPHHNYDVFDHILKVLDNTPADLMIRWAALLHDIAKPITFFLDKDKKGRFFGHDKKGAAVAKKVLNRIGYEEKFTEDVAALIETHMSRYNTMKEKGVRKLINKVGEKNMEKLFQLQRADIKGRHGPHDFTKVDNIENMVKEIINSN